MPRARKLAALIVLGLSGSCGHDQRAEGPGFGPSRAGGRTSTGGTGGAGVESTSGGAPTSSGSAGSSGGPGNDTQLEKPILFEDILLPDGSRSSIIVDGERVHRFVPNETEAKTKIDGSELYVSPAFVDSHVHLTYLPRANDLSASGVLAAVDLASPLSALEAPPSVLHLLPAGPMITSVAGYPTQSWGRNGYGVEVASVEAARTAVSDLLSAGARVIKVPLDGDNSPNDDQVAAVVQLAHESGVKVAAHALTVAGVERAAALGCDVLAHTPVEELPEALILQFSDRAVISTLRAFGATETTKNNLGRLYAAGATVLYGTDFGNTRLAAIDTQELEWLIEAGLSRAAALAAGTSAPSAYWSIDEGRFAINETASFLVLSGDPTTDFSSLSPPLYVFYRGTQLRGPEAP